MRISDWSSDVCSSDLRILDFLYRDQDLAVILRQRPVVACACGFDARTAGAAFEQRQADRRPPRPALRGIAAMHDAVDADHAAETQRRQPAGDGDADQTATAAGTESGCERA